MQRVNERMNIIQANVFLFELYEADINKMQGSSDSPLSCWIK